MAEHTWKQGWNANGKLKKKFKQYTTQTFNVSILQSTLKSQSSKNQPIRGLNGEFIKVYQYKKKSSISGVSEKNK